jgi:hypothetical protein
LILNFQRRFTVALIPNVAAMFKWVNSFFPAAKGGSQDFVQLIRESDGEVLGWIDESGTLRGSLATGSGGGADIEVAGTPIAGTTANLNGTTPAAPNGSAPVAFQADSGNPTTNISASIAPFVASGASHAPGAVPDPGASAGTKKFLREDATFDVPAVFGASGASHASGYVPDPGGSAGTMRYLREDATFDVPPGSSPPVQTTTAGGTSLASGAIGQSILSLNGAFTILSVACNGPLRLRLYSTAAAQTADLSRPNTIPPTPGTAHGVICDLYLQTSGQYTNWILSPAAPGANGDSPQTATVYCSITNLSVSTASPSATITWL